MGGAGAGVGAGAGLPVHRSWQKRNMVSNGDMAGRGGERARRAWKETTERIRGKSSGDDGHCSEHHRVRGE